MSTVWGVGRGAWGVALRLVALTRDWSVGVSVLVTYVGRWMPSNVQIPLVLASSKPGFRPGFRPGFEQKKSLNPGFRLVCDQTPTFYSGRTCDQQ